MDFVTGVGVPEGPVVLPDKSWLIVEMSEDRGCVTHISADGQTKRVIAKTGRPNGLAVDREGAIWCAESEEPSLLRMTMDGKVEVFLTECDGEPFLFPNDIAFDSNGKLYLTDSGILFSDFVQNGAIRSDYNEIRPDGRVYQICTKTKAIKKLDGGIRFTNGIAFGPDQDLYVNETLTGMVYRYKCQDGEVVGGREDFGNVIDPDGPPGPCGPDGMAFGTDGNLYVTVWSQGHVAVLGPDGAVLRRIRTAGSGPTNVAFGPAGEKRIYVTEVERGALEIFDVDTDGLPLFD